MLEEIAGRPDLDAQLLALGEDEPEWWAKYRRELRAFFHAAAYPSLADDVDALFARERSGHMLRHIFNDKAMPIFDAFTEQVPAYLATEEIRIIHDNTRHFRKIGRELYDRRGNENGIGVVELGTGKAHAQKFKTIPTLEAMQPDSARPITYVGIDYSPGSTLESMITVADHFSGASNGSVEADIRIRDFFRDNYRLDGDLPRLFLMYGNTFANLEGPANGMPADQMNAGLSNIRRHMNAGDYLILGVQQDRHEDRSYRHPLFHEFHLHFLNYVKEAMHDGSNFRPNDFTFFVRWDAKTSNHVFGYRAVRDGWVKPRPCGPIRNYAAGDEFITCNSWRFRQKFLNQAYAATGFALKKVLRRRFDFTLKSLLHRRMSLQVLQAVKSPAPPAGTMH